MMWRFTAVTKTELVTLAALITLALASGAGGDACVQSGKRYEAMEAEVVGALRDYERCVAESRARDTCEAEFGDLDLAQTKLQQLFQGVRSNSLGLVSERNRNMPVSVNDIRGLTQIRDNPTIWLGN